MTVIWHNDQSTWRLLTPSAFPTERELHDLVEEAPQTLPLAGDPQLLVVGREVLLDGNKADLIAIEPRGRLAVIEIKLATNAEARRAVIAQILAYAATLHGMDVARLEQTILQKHLAQRGVTTLAQVVADADQVDAFDAEAFHAELSTCLRAGRFRLVLVLDSAPPELVRLVGYLQTVADKLVIDLITVAAYDIAGTRIIVPQRVEPEPPTLEPTSRVGTDITPTSQLTPGMDAFITAIETVPKPDQAPLRRLADWAVMLEREGLARLHSYQGTSDRMTLLPRLITDGVGLVTIWNDKGASLQFWRSVFERRAPLTLSRIDDLLGPGKVGRGTTTRAFSEDLLDVLTAAYREAAQAHLRATPDAALAHGAKES